MCVRERERECVCVCVCVCEREREKGEKGGGRVCTKYSPVSKCT